jgi:hypothetical protein
MYTPINTIVTIEQADIDLVNAIADKNDQILIQNLLVSVIDTNGTSSTITPGLGKQYIDQSQFFHVVNRPDDPSKYLVPMATYDAVERALNWNACGRGKGGIAASAVREFYRDKVDAKRETIYVDFDIKKQGPLLKDYLAELEMHKMIHAFWKANAANVIALAAAVMLKEGHHWDATNQRPQRAILAALDQKDVFSDADMRKLFYLSVHPYPLPELMMYVSRPELHKDLNEAVRCRLRAPPAGTAGFIIAAIGAKHLVNEEFYKFATDAFKNDFAKLQKASDDIMSNPLAYHTMATLFTAKPRLDLPQIPIETLALNIAYIRTCVKGSLASAPSLNKLADQNARLVQKYNAALDRYVETRSADIAEMISAGTDSYRKLERMERNEEILEDAKVRAAVMATAVNQPI